jgi:hypothetical protein
MEREVKWATGSGRSDVRHLVPPPTDIHTRAPDQAWVVRLSAEDPTWRHGCCFPRPAITQPPRSVPIVNTRQCQPQGWGWPGWIHRSASVLRSDCDRSVRTPSDQPSQLTSMTAWLTDSTAAFFRELRRAHAAQGWATVLADNGRPRIGRVRCLLTARTTYGETPSVSLPRCWESMYAGLTSKASVSSLRASRRSKTPGSSGLARG